MYFCLVYTLKINVTNNIYILYKQTDLLVYTPQNNVTNNYYVAIRTWIYLYIHLKTMLLTTGYLKLIDIQLIIFEMLQIIYLKLS